MKFLAFAALALGLAAGAPAAAQEKFERTGPREYKYEYDDGRHVVKRERKGRDYKYEAKHGDHERKYERKQDGSWKEEVKSGNCVLKRERTSDGQYKEERSC